MSRNQVNSWSDKEASDLHEAMRACDSAEQIADFMKQRKHPARTFGAYEFQVRTRLAAWTDVTPDIHDKLKAARVLEEKGRRRERKAKREAASAPAPVVAVAPVAAAKKPAAKPAEAQQLFDRREWMPANEMCQKHVNYSDQAIHNLAGQGLIARMPVGGGRYFYSLTSVKAYMAANSRAPGKPTHNSPRLVAYEAFSKEEAQVLSMREACFILNIMHANSFMRGLVKGNGIPMSKIDRIVHDSGLSEMKAWERQGFIFGAPYDQQPGVHVGSPLRAPKPRQGGDKYRLLDYPPGSARQPVARVEKTTLTAPVLIKSVPVAKSKPTTPAATSGSSYVSDSFNGWLTDGVKNGYLTEEEAKDKLFKNFQMAIKGT